MSYIKQLFDGQEAKTNQQTSVEFKIVTSEGELSSDNSSLFITGMDGASIPDDNFDFAYYPALTSYGPKNPGIYAQRSLSVTFEDFEVGDKGSEQAYTKASNYMSFLNGGSEIEFHVIIDGTDKYVQGWISGVDFPYFEEGFSLTLNILCADPYWYEDFVYAAIRNSQLAHLTILEKPSIEIPSPVSLSLEAYNYSFNKNVTFEIYDRTDGSLNITSTADKKIELKFVRGEYKIFFDNSEQPLSIIRSPFEYPYIHVGTEDLSVSVTSLKPANDSQFNVKYTLHRRSLSLI